MSEFALQRTLNAGTGHVCLWTRCGSDLSFVAPLRVFSGRSRRGVLPDRRKLPQRSVAAWRLVEVLTLHAVASCGHHASL